MQACDVGILKLGVGLTLECTTKLIFGLTFSLIFCPSKWINCGLKIAVSPKLNPKICLTL